MMQRLNLRFLIATGLTFGVSLASFSLYVGWSESHHDDGHTPVPAAAIHAVNAWLLVDRTGSIVGMMPKQTTPSYPLLSGIDIRGFASGDTRTRAAVLRGIELGTLLIDGAATITPGRVPTLDMRNPRNIMVNFRGSRIQFGDGGFREKWNRVSLVERAGESILMIGLEIDLRFPDRIVIREMT